MNNHLLKVGIVALALGFSSISQAAYSGISVFGDSLSDIGNAWIGTGGVTTGEPFAGLVPSAPYTGGRFSNGPVWVEHLASDMGLSLLPSVIGGTGYAFGGARTGALTGITPSGIPTLSDQLGMVPGGLAPGSLSSDALYVVWGGGNDMRDAGVAASAAFFADLGGGGDFASASAAANAASAVIINDSLNNIGTILSTLAAAGATDFLVPNLPNLGLTPEAQAGGSTAVEGAMQLAAAFNFNLESLVLSPLDSVPGINITRLDVFGFSNAIAADPAAFGFLNASDPCIAVGGGACSNPDSYFFWDGIHPTAAAHRLLADGASAALSAVPVPAALPLLLSALGLMGLLGRRRSV